jgi:hypothetical protein
MNRGVASGAIGIRVGEALMELGSEGMAAKTQVRHILVFQHMTVGRAMDIVTGRAALDFGRRVFIDKGTAFIGMTLKTGFLFKAAQSFPDSRSMDIMATGAFQNAFMQPVPLIQLELRGHILVTTGA